MGCRQGMFASAASQLAALAHARSGHCDMQPHASTVLVAIEVPVVGLRALTKTTRTLSIAHMYMATLPQAIVVGAGLFDTYEFNHRVNRY
ncbi:hypothetical protein RSAG8_13079, partial [Rhizoctonia solani AG-8 WAC10335]